MKVKIFELSQLIYKNALVHMYVSCEFNLRDIYIDNSLRLTSKLAATWMVGITARPFSLASSNSIAGSK